jgi:hypothetical protein
MPKCDQCGRDFSSVAALAQHVKDKHGVPGAASKGTPVSEPSPVKRQKAVRRRGNHYRAYAAVALVVVVGVGVYFLASPYLSPPPFACITGESWMHLHPYLVIDIEGKNVTIPQGVGIVEGGSCFEPIHTHDASGILHIELSQSDSQSHNYTIGDFFNIWSYTVKSGALPAPTLNGATLPVVFSSTDILGFQTNSTYQVVLLVDGKPNGNGTSLNLEQLAYCGTASQGPPCYPTACTTATSCGPPLWKGTNNDPYGTGHIIVIEYLKV